MSQELYNLLKEGESREIPWHVAAEHFLKLKVASGALLPEDVEELHEEVAKVKSAAAPEPITREDIGRMARKGYLSGIRSTVTGDMARHNNLRRKRGERVGKTLGSLAGAASGALVSKKNPIAGAALGTVLGYASGKAVGEEYDHKRLRRRKKPKSASIEKVSDFGEEAEEKQKKPNPLPHLAGGAAAGATAGTAWHGKKLLDSLNVAEKKMFGKAGATGGTVRERLQEAVRGINKGSTGATGRMAWGRIGGGALAGTLTGAGVYAVHRKLQQKKKGLKKTAQEPALGTPDEAIPVEAPVAPTMDPAQLGAQEAALTGQQDPVDALLQAQQAANEAEFFRQKAEEAEMAAGQESERADMAEGQAQQATEMANQQAQESAMREQQIGQQAQVATQQAQMASQDSVQARNEALSAQHQNIALRQAVTNFRQSLMDLVAQDPTQMMGPPAVPQGPMPMGPEGGAPPPQEGAPPPQEGAAPPPPQGGAPMGQPPMQQQPMEQPPMAPPPPPPPVQPMAPPPPAGAPGTQPPPPAGMPGA